LSREKAKRFGDGVADLAGKKSKPPRFANQGWGTQQKRKREDKSKESMIK
jgi:hypothetical protein